MPHSPGIVAEEAQLPVGEPRAAVQIGERVLLDDPLPRQPVVRVPRLGEELRQQRREGARRGPRPRRGTGPSRRERAAGQQAGAHGRAHVLEAKDDVGDGRGRSRACRPTRRNPPRPRPRRRSRRARRRSRSSPARDEWARMQALSVGRQPVMRAGRRRDRCAAGSPPGWRVVDRRRARSRPLVRRGRGSSPARLFATSMNKLSSRPTRTCPPIVTAIAFIGSWNRPIPAAAQVAPGAPRSARSARWSGVAAERAQRAQQEVEVEGLAQDAPLDQVRRVVEHSHVEDLELGHDPPLPHAVGQGADGLRVVDRGLAGKFIEPRVRDAMSGFSAPSRSRASARCSTLLTRRPLVVTQMIDLGCPARTRATISRRPPCGGSADPPRRGRGGGRRWRRRRRSVRCRRRSPRDEWARGVVGLGRHHPGAGQVHDQGLVGHRPRPRRSPRRSGPERRAPARAPARPWSPGRRPPPPSRRRR